MVRKLLKVGSVLAVAVLLGMPAGAATKPVDLDGQPTNGAESACELNVLQTFPVKIENKVTNKAIGEAFSFFWASAGPGGYGTTVGQGTAGGVGSIWTWTSNQTMVSFTGNSCTNDVCFNQTAGSPPDTSYCSLACLADGTTATVARGAQAGQVVLNWTGGTGPFTVFRSTSKAGVGVPANALTTTDLLTYTDAAPPAGAVFYLVRGVDCSSRKSCFTDADCNAPGDGACVSRGPFSVPGRSLLATDVTVSAASLTSSLITFFSPPQVLFSMTTVAGPGGEKQIVTSHVDSPITVATQEYPPGCCPPNEDGDQQLRCGEGCVDFLNDNENCGACGTVCDEDACCSGGTCASVCSEGQTLCDGQCVDLANDSLHCGACGLACEDGTCCHGGVCASICGEGETYCGNGECADLDNDNNNCGACGNVCADGTCCSDGVCASLCDEGTVWCGEGCADLQDDSGNCGACGVACGEGTCCNDGTCVSVCAEGQVWCNGQCVDLQNDSGNCGACGNACGEGTCCSEGVCASACPAGQVFCNGQCVDLQNDSGNCGACGNACGEGTCCSEGVCASLCGAGRTLCGELCYDTQNDPNNCGGCGIVCDDQSICSGGSCQRCTGQGGRRDACDNRCVNFNTDPYNCGGCGISCQEQCPSNFHGVCSNGLSCTCEEGVPPPPPPPGIPEPTEPSCPNPNPTTPGPTSCPNPNPTDPVPGSCPNPDPSPGPVPGSCPNPDLTYGPVPGVCPNPNPTDPVPAVCPEPGELPSGAPFCEVEATLTSLPPGGTSTICNPGGILFKEVPTAIKACGDDLPGPDGDCGGGTTHVSTGTFMRLIPDTSKTVGNAYLTPYAVLVLAETSGDGLLGPEETGTLLIKLVNAGPVDVTSATATLVPITVDMTDDGTTNPVGLEVLTGTSSYGTIQGTIPSDTCTPTLYPASNAEPFQVTVPPDFPGDSGAPMKLVVDGTVNGEPFHMDVPLTLGIVDRCDPLANNRDFDGLDGLLNPMAKLVPAGDPVPFPSKAFSAGNTRPMKLRVFCGEENLDDASVDAPQIVGLSEETRGPLDINLLNLNADNGTNPNDPFFRFNNALTLSGGPHWGYTIRTSLLGTGRFTITIRIAGRKEYVTGFVLE